MRNLILTALMSPQSAYGGMPVCVNGAGCGFDEERAVKLLSEDENHYFYRVEQGDAKQQPRAVAFASRFISAKCVSSSLMDTPFSSKHGRRRF